MKQCTKCKKSKLESEFYKDKSKKDGLYYCCKICHTIVVKIWQEKNNYYAKNKEKICARSRKAQTKKREFYIEYKKTLKCQKCGENHTACLEFHHRNPDEKKFSVAVYIFAKSVELLKEEIAKCDVLCANCHRKLHYNEKMSEV